MHKYGYMFSNEADKVFYDVISSLAIWNQIEKQSKYK